MTPFRISHFLHSSPGVLRMSSSGKLDKKISSEVIFIITLYLVRTYPMKVYIGSTNVSSSNIFTNKTPSFSVAFSRTLSGFLVVVLFYP